MSVACPQWLQDMTIEQIHAHYVFESNRTRTHYAKVKEVDDYGEVEMVERRVYSEGEEKGKKAWEDDFFDEGLYMDVLQIHLAIKQHKALTRMLGDTPLPQKDVYQNRHYPIIHGHRTGPQTMTDNISALENKLMHLRLGVINGRGNTGKNDEEKDAIEKEIEKRTAMKWHELRVYVYEQFKKKKGE